MTVASLMLFGASARADELPEYRLKAAFIYNFIAYTEWPAETGSTLNLCIQGADPFGKEIDGLQGKVVAGRTIALARKVAGDSLKDCQVVFIASSVINSLPHLLEGVRGQPVLTVADSPGAMRRGVMLNMNISQGKVTFDANLLAARGARLQLSSKLLRLATEVQQ
ncbi:MAG: YfiR family protein [Burkholderiales bacterium]|nr:YfiR family protein [Burkholderiales bacterium]